MNKYNNSQDISQYLQEKNVPIIKNESREIVTHCIFSTCDKDSRKNKGHLYFEKESGMYNCKKCDAKGNLITLKKHFGDFTPPSLSRVEPKIKFTQNLVNECAENSPERIRKYLNERGVSDEIISEKKVGFGNFYGSNFLTIPVTKTEEAEPSFFYLRKDPENKNENTPKNLSFPKGKGETMLYGDFAGSEENLVICEGIMDCLSLLSLGVKTVTSTGGCMTFKDDWLDEKLLSAKNIFVAYDLDEAGEKGSAKVLKLLKDAGHKNLYKITLPEVVGDKGDVNDYLAKHKLPVGDLFTKYAEEYPKDIDCRQFKELSLADVEEVLDLTIKGDRENKLITFFCQLSAFTEKNQFNVMFNSPSSSGKSYTALETSKLFPKESLIKLGHSSATAFFHETGKYDKERNTIVVDLSRKILIFTENQHYQMLEKLRGFLSHDEKVMVIKVTDKGQKGGNKTKTVELIGYASVVFCTANLKCDEQEKTRFLILSPEITDNKIRAGINKVLEREGGNNTFEKMLDSNLCRKNLKLRIEAIRNLEIKDILISEEDIEYFRQKFYLSCGNLQARHQRDIKRFIDLAKSIALLNVWYRNLSDGVLKVQRYDIDSAVSLLSKIVETQNLNISPFVYDFYKEIISPCFWAKNQPDFAIVKYVGITYQEIQSYFFKVRKVALNYTNLVQNILPELTSCGLVYTDKEENSNKKLVFVSDLGSASQSCVGVSGVNK